MTNHEYNEMRRRHCEAIVRDTFHLHLPVDELLFDDIETGPNSYAVLFWSGRHLYGLFIDNNGQQTLGDVQSMMRHMGIKPLKVLPPYADMQYFAREAKRRFLMTFPSIKTIDAETVKFYQSYAPYSPGLVRISEVDSPIKRYAPNASAWRNAFEYSFKRIQVS